VPVELAARGHHVGEAVDRVQPGEGEAVAPRGDAEAALEGALGDVEAALVLGADQEQLADLVGGDGQREVVLAQPGGEAGRGRDLVGRGAVAAAADLDRPWWGGCWRCCSSGGADGRAGPDRPRPGRVAAAGAAGKAGRMHARGSPGGPCRGGGWRVAPPRPAGRAAGAAFY
jgi:hypothetical protein